MAKKKGNTNENESDFKSLEAIENVSAGTPEGNDASVDQDEKQELSDEVKVEFSAEAENPAIQAENEENKDQIGELNLLDEKEFVVSIKVADPSHLKPMAEPGELPQRPEAVSDDHLKPQEEKSEQREVKVADPKHLKPQE